MTRESISPDFRERILKRDRYTCRYCGSKKGPFHLDHVYPVSKGGETSYGNLVTSCQSCNSRKYNQVGIFPKPIGYFDSKFSEKQYKTFIRCGAMILAEYFLVMTVVDGLNGNTASAEINIVFALILSFPVFVDAFLSNFTNNKE